MRGAWAAYPPGLARLVLAAEDALGSVLDGLSGGPHGIVLEVDGDGDGITRTLWLDGEPSPALEEALAATRFAGAPGLQIRQFYLYDE